jgi:hypothetical protein
LGQEQISPEHKERKVLKERRVLKELKVVVNQLFMGHLIINGQL